MLQLKIRSCFRSSYSQWQTRTKSIFFLLYRLALAIFFTGVVINSVVVAVERGEFSKYFIYLTHWGILLCMGTTIMGAILVMVWHFHPEYSGKPSKKKQKKKPSH